MVHVWTILGQTVSPVRDVLVSDWWDYYRLTLAELDTAQRAGLCRSWAMQFVRFDADVDAEITDAGGWSMVCDQIVIEAGWPGGTQQHLRYVLDIITGAEKYDPKKAEQKCECPKCRGDENGPPVPCRFEVRVLDDGARVKIPQVARDLAFSIRPDLVAQYWDKPIALYELAVESSSSTSLGAAAARQKHKPDPKKEARDEVRDQYWRRFGLPPFPGD